MATSSLDWRRFYRDKKHYRFLTCNHPAIHSAIPPSTHLLTHTPPFTYPSIYPSKEYLLKGYYVPGPCTDSGQTKIGGNNGQVGGAIREGFWRCGQTDEEESLEQRKSIAGRRESRGRGHMEGQPGCRGRQGSDPIEGGTKEDHVCPEGC